MNRFVFTFAAGVFALALSSCATEESISMGGVPEWVAEGAKLQKEPAPVPPDPAIIRHEDESGPVEFFIVTDNQKYPEPGNVTKKKEVSIHDQIESGRDSRIKRLVR